MPMPQPPKTLDYIPRAPAKLVRSCGCSVRVDRAAKSNFPGTNPTHGCATDLAGHFVGAGLKPAREGAGVIHFRQNPTTWSRDMNGNQAARLRMGSVSWNRSYRAALARLDQPDRR